MKRLWNWQSALDALLVQHAAERFKYGSWDCCLFACDAIFAMTGTDPAGAFRGRYHTRAQARQLIHPFAERIAAIARQNDMPEVPVSMAQRGDLVMLQGECGLSLGIVSLS